MNPSVGIMGILIMFAGPIALVLVVLVLFCWAVIGAWRWITR